MAENQTRNKTLANALGILEKFAGNDMRWGVRELARETENSPATVYRILATFATAGYLEKDVCNDEYRLGPKIMLIAESYINQNPVEKIARDVFQSYSRRFEHNLYLAQMLNDEVVYLATHEGRGPIIISSTPGVSVELYCTALGKALLAAQDDAYVDNYLKQTKLKAYTAMTITDPEKLRAAIEEIRSVGYAINHGERFQGVGSIGVCLPECCKAKQMAVSIAYPTFFLENHTLELPALIELTQQIADEIASRVPAY